MQAPESTGPGFRIYLYDLLISCVTKPSSVIRTYGRLPPGEVGGFEEAVNAGTGEQTETVRELAAAPATSITTFSPPSLSAF